MMNAILIHVAATMVYQINGLKQGEV